MERYTQDQIREYHDAFCMFDRSNKGYILSIELREMLKTVGFNPTDKLLEELSIMVDCDGNGEIDFDEFVDLIDQLETEDAATKEAQDAFNAFDFMGQGFIAANDLREALLHVLEKTTEIETSDVINHFKLGKNRKVYFKEFKDMITMKNYKVHPQRK